MSSLLNMAHRDIHGLHIETPKEMNDSPFRRAYEGAFTCLNDIIQEQTRKNSTEILEKKRESPLNTNYFFDVDEPNTVIAFTGDRGEGKTSAMLSFLGWLHNFSYNNKVIQEAEEAILLSSQADLDSQSDGSTPLPPWQGFALRSSRDIRFHVLQVIDPTRMNEQDSILGNVVARMFAQYNDDLLDHTPSIEQRRQFVQAAEKVYQIVQMFYDKGKRLQENMEALEGLISVAEMQMVRKRLYELVCAYLALQIPTSVEKVNPKHYLVIPVDDLDMNSEHAVRFTEELRRYFMMPNVIIVLAASISQLSDAIEASFSHSVRQKENGKSAYHELATKYINKFLPLAHRQYMPSLEELNVGDLHVKVLGIQNDPAEAERRLVDHMLRLIYDKTGLLLVQDARRSHAVLPTNLRALQQLNKMLTDLKNVDVYFVPPKEKAKRIEAFTRHQKRMRANQATFKKNLVALQNYVVYDRISGLATGEEWIESKAENVLIGVARSMIKVHWQNLNAFVVDALRGLLTNHEDYVLQRILDASKYPETLSMGDVMYLLGQVQRDHVGREVGGLISIIHLLYSMQLLQLYYHAVSHSPVTYPSTNQGDAFESFRKLIGGFVFEPDSVQFVPSASNEVNDWRRDVEIAYLPWGQEEASEGNENTDSRLGVDRTVGSLYEAIGDAWKEWNEKKDEEENASLRHQSMLASLEHLQFYVGYYGRPTASPSNVRAIKESTTYVVPEQWRKHGRPTDEYYCFPLTYPNSGERRTDHFSFNYTTCIANALTPFQTCNRIFDWLFRESNGATVSEKMLDQLHVGFIQHQESQTKEKDAFAKESSFTLKRMCEWQRVYHTLLPVYSLDWMHTLFNKMRAQARNQRKAAIETGGDDALGKLVFFWDVVASSLEDTLSDAPYLREEEKELLRQALVECPLYQAVQEREPETDWIACSMENQRCTMRSRARIRYLDAKEHFNKSDRSVTDIDAYIQISQEMIEFAGNLPASDLPTGFGALSDYYSKDENFKPYDPQSPSLSEQLKVAALDALSEKLKAK